VLTTSNKIKAVAPKLYVLEEYNSHNFGVAALWTYNFQSCVV